MSSDQKLTRRLALQAGLGLAASVTAGRLQAEAVTPPVEEGPFFPTREQLDKDADLTRIQGRSEAAAGDVIQIHGRVVDEAGAAVAGALVDLWQANTHGRYDHEDDPNPAPLDPNFQGWAQLRSDAEGRFSIRTIKPGAYPVSVDWTRPPHLHFKVAKRGYRELTTQMFFAGDVLNGKDRLFQEIPADQRQRVTVEFRATDSGAPAGDFTIVIGKVAAA
jgi:protocatechuate 3,4-dioxygenase beta subunit